MDFLLDHLITKILDFYGVLLKNSYIRLCIFNYE